MLKLRYIPLLVAMLLALVAAPAANAGYRDAIDDCAKGRPLDGKYTRAELKKARQNLPADLAEYTPCPDELAVAKPKGSRGAGGAGGSGGNPSAGSAGDPALRTNEGAQASTREDLDALGRDANPRNFSKKPAKVQIAGRDVTPGAAGLFDRAGATDANDLPLPLLLALISVAAMAALTGLLVMRRQWPTARRAALRLFGR